jgi:hypothetical protein
MCDEVSAWFQLYELEMLRKLGKSIMNSCLSIVVQVDTIHPSNTTIRPIFISASYTMPTVFPNFRS